MHQIAPRDTARMEDNDSSEDVISIRKIIGKVLAIWPWMVVSLVLSIGLALAYASNATRMYRVRASILVQDEKKSSDLGGSGILQDLGLLGGKSNVENEAEIFKSRTLMKEVVTKLQLAVHYCIPGKIKNKEVYLESPIRLQFIGMTDSFPGSQLDYRFQFDAHNPTLFTLSNDDGLQLKGRLGDTLNLKEGRATVIASAGYATWNAAQPLLISLYSTDATTQYYMGALSVDIPNDKVSVIYLTLESGIPAKGQHVLNSLINAYMQANVNDKNRIADSTMRFIEDRLALVSGELSGIEKEIEGFKTSNKLTDISEQSKILLDNTNEFMRQQTQQEVQLTVVRSLEEFLKDRQNDARSVPSSLIMQDATFVALVQRYNEMQLEKDKLLMSHTPEHPSIKSLDLQLTNVRAEVLSSINSIKRGFEVSIGELKRRNAGIENTISRVPAKQRVFLDFSRQQAIKQELYLFLLKKLEETAISKSSTLANARLVDAAKADAGPFAPKKSMILMTAFVIGLLVPLVITITADYFNNRVDSLEIINELTSAPVLAEIGHNPDKTVISISKTSRQLIAEQLRSLRTSLQYLLPNEQEKTVLLTSSMSGEGKSFLSINLSTALALAGKKVILLELDLRKPKITENLQLKKTGFTNYIIDNESNWRNWIQPSGVDDNFDVLSSGPLPPNPTELLMLPKTKHLFEELKDNYDYILIDSPPVGLVTDAEIVASYADATIYVVRHRYTFKQQIGLIEKFFRKRLMPKINIVVNDVRMKKAGYGYNYGYGYGYGYGTYEGEKSVKNKKKLAK